MRLIKKVNEPFYPFFAVDGRNFATTYAITTNNKTKRVQYPYMSNCRINKQFILLNLIQYKRELTILASKEYKNASRWNEFLYKIKLQRKRELEEPYMMTFAVDFEWLYEAKRNDLIKSSIQDIVYDGNKYYHIHILVDNVLKPLYAKYHDKINELVFKNNALKKHRDFHMLTRTSNAINPETKQKQICVYYNQKAEKLNLNDIHITKDDRQLVKYELCFYDDAITPIDNLFEFGKTNTIAKKLCIYLKNSKQKCDYLESILLLFILGFREDFIKDTISYFFTNNNQIKKLGYKSIKSIVEGYERGLNCLN